MVVQKQPSARGKWIIWEIFIYRQWNVNFIYCLCVMIIFFWFSFQLFQNTKPLLAWGSYKHRRRITCDPQAIVSWSLCCCSEAKLCLTLCDPHGLQQARLCCPSLSLQVCSNSCPASRWSHSTISSSVTPFSSCPQSFPESGSFPMSQLFTSGD